MTPKELAELAQLINEKWPDPRVIALEDRFDLMSEEYDPTGTGLLYRDVIVWKFSEPDWANGQWIIWAFEKLETLLVDVKLATVANASGVIGYRVVAGGMSASPIETRGKTKAECLARALYEALREKKG